MPSTGSFFRLPVLFQAQPSQPLERPPLRQTETESCNPGMFRRSHSAPDIKLCQRIHIRKFLWEERIEQHPCRVVICKAIDKCMAQLVKTAMPKQKVMEG